jgi:D-alanine-D-alanine ligase
MKKRIGVIFGGRSGEHEISIRSAKTVVEQIDRSKYDVIPIAIEKTGRWLSPFESAALLPGSVREAIPDDVLVREESQLVLSGDPGVNGLLPIEGGGVPLPIDIVFPVLHGTYGEDGTIQGLLEMADVPYVGCGVLGSSCGMDKVTMKVLFKAAGLPICKYTWFTRKEWETDVAAVRDKIMNAMRYPVFVKPANLGSSVGVSRADDDRSLDKAVSLAAEYDRKIIVEEALQMREIECAVLGNDDAKASRPGEYIIRDSSKAFLDYTEKYAGTGNNEFVVPAPISPELEAKIREMAVAAFKAIDGSGLARVDFFLRTDNGMLLVNEINTMPGLTDSSGFPKMWAGSGMTFTAVIDELIDLAIERHAEKARTKTTFND